MQFVGLDTVLPSPHTYLLTAVSLTYCTRKLTLNMIVWQSPTSKDLCSVGQNVLNEIL